MGFTAFIRLNRLMGLIGAGVYDRVGHHPAGYEAGSFQGQSVLAIRGKQNGTGYPFRLRPEIVAALIELGFSAHVNDAASLPGEIGLEDVNTYLEGRVRPVWVNAVERNRQARLTCLGRYGYTCFCCGVDLQAKYGEALRARAPFEGLGSDRGRIRGRSDCRPSPGLSQLPRCDSSKRPATRRRGRARPLLSNTH